MRIKQISVFLENKPGRLAAVTRALWKNGINMRALSLADTSDFGILRFIASDPDCAVAVLKQEGFATHVTDVLAVEVPDAPGGLAHIMELLDGSGVSVEYLYAFTERRQDRAMVIFRVEDIETAASALEAGGVQVVRAEDVYTM